MRDESNDDDPLEADCRRWCLQNSRITICSIAKFMDNYACTRLSTWYILYAFLVIIIFEKGMLLT